MFYHRVTEGVRDKPVLFEEKVLLLTSGYNTVAALKRSKTQTVYTTMMMYHYYTALFSGIYPWARKKWLF